MKPLVALGLVVLAGCSWSNSLYHARRLSQSALKAEREERTFDAGSFWGQVAVKADSAYARDPQGGSAAEALWLRGRALARLGDCAEARPLLDRAFIASGTAGWRDDLALELARCQSIGGDIDGALQVLAPLIESEDDDLREQARNLAGRALVRGERWEAARAFLAEDESAEGRWLYALALGRLGRGAEAIGIVGPRIEAGDSLANWDELFRALAAVENPGADSTLRARLLALRWVTDTMQQRWNLAVAEMLLPRDREAALRLLEEMAAGPVTPATSNARMLLAEQVIAAVTDSGALVGALARVATLGRNDPTAMFRVQRFLLWGGAIRADLDSLAIGAPEGDLAMFFAAGIARDTLGAPRLAAWLLGRLERGWPASPYVPKALLVRMTLEPDSLDALRARLERHGDSPYLAYLAGREDARFAELEDALQFYLSDRAAGAAVRGEQ